MVFTQRPKGSEAEGTGSAKGLQLTGFFSSDLNKYLKRPVWLVGKE